MSLFSWAILYMEGAMVFSDKVAEGGTGAAVLVATILVAGFWWLINKGQVSTSRVISRGFLMGTLMWMAFIPATTLLSAKLASAQMTGDAASDFGSGLGAVIISFIGGAGSFVMMGICLLIAIIAHLMGQEKTVVVVQQAADGTVATQQS